MVHVVELDQTDSVLARWGDPLAVLTSAERTRAGQFQAEGDANDFVAAHLLIRECVAKMLNTDARPAGQIVIDQRCERCGGPHGRPTVIGEPAIRPAWSHSHGHVAAAAADRAIGIDIEVRTMLAIEDGLLARIATETEAQRVRAEPDDVGALLRLWVLKEALVKAGAMTLDDFSSIALDDVTGFTLTTLDPSDQMAIGLALGITS